jgi:hypothetical protein
MFAKKTMLAAVALAALTAAGLGAANAQPRDMARDHRGPVATHQTVRHDIVRHEVRRTTVTRLRVAETLRMHRYVGLGDPYFFHGHYVVRSHDRFGHLVLVQIDPWTGRFIGTVRI